MSTTTLESPDMKNMQVEPHAPTLANRSAPQPSTEFSGALYQSLAALNSTWAAFINHRLKEDLTLPEQLGQCRSLSGTLSVYGAYCRTAIAQYQAAFAQFQQIGLNLASKLPAAGLVPVRIPTVQHEHTARSSDRAARDCFP